MSDVQYQLRNISIVLIVFGALAIALGIIDIVTGAGPWSLAGLGGYFVWAGILGICQGIYQVIVGWIGCTKVHHPEHIGAFYIAAWTVWVASKIRVFENPMLRNG